MQKETKVNNLFIRRPVLTIVLSLTLVLAGIISIFVLPIAKLPPVLPPTVEVSAVYPGASAEVVEETVIVWLEDVINGTPGMIYMDSQSSDDGNATITVTFELGYDVNTAELDVLNRITEATPRLPAEVQRMGISVRKVSPNLVLSMMLYDKQGRYDSNFLSNYAQIYMLDDMARVPGVGGIRYRGQRIYAMRIWLDPDKLATRNLTAGDVVALQDKQGNSIGTQGVGRDITEHKQAEEALQETYERYRTLFEESLNPIFMVDEGGRYTDANKAAFEFMECDREELIGKEVWDFAPPDLLEQQKREHYHFMSPRTIDTGYYIHGATKTLLLNVVPVTLSGKTTLYGIGHNITERKKVEKALQQSEEKYRDLVETINQAIIATDENGILTYVSPRIEQFSGYTVQELIGKSPFDFIYEDDIAFARERLKKLISGEMGMVEYRIVTKTGEIRWVQTFNRPIFKDNQLAGFRGVITDITEKKKSEIALKESEERYRTLVETITDIVFIVDLYGKIAYLNPISERISGYPVKELIGRSVTELLPPEPIKSTLELFRRGLSGEETPIEEISIVHKDGSQVPVEINATTLFDAEGKPVGRIGVIRDISERKRLEAHLLQAQRLESIGILAGGIAHDFDNILSIIRGFTDIAIREVPEKSSAKQNLDRALRGIQRAADLVKQIIAFSRQSKPERRPVLVSPIAEDAVSLLKASLPSTIEIRLDIQTEIGTIYADPTQIHQVLMNLGTNAAHAMREKGGILEVSLSEVEMDAAALAGLPDISPGDYLRMTVSDTGEGMSPEVLGRIFDPYFSTKERGEGTGLGLSVVHGIVKGHGGTITVHSKPRKGTTFHVYLPLLDYRAEPEEQIGGYEPLPGGNERILFVDDEEDMVFLVGQLLGSLGYEVVTRMNAMDALELFRGQPDRFDLVITDMAMPGMTGKKLAEQIKKIRRDTPIILCTGFGEDITKEKARRMGIREVMLKPLVNIDLTKTIRKVLDKN